MTADSARPDLVGATGGSLAEEQFRLAVEACPNGMVMTDRDGKMVMVNTEIEQQFGYRHEELIGQCVDMLVPTRLLSQYARQRDAFNRRPQTHRIGSVPDLFGLRKDGSEFPVEVGLTPIRVNNGLLVLGVIVDVSERRHIERLKDEFVANVSHELRTPLTSISGSLSLLVGQWADKLPDPAMRLLAIANKNCQRLVRLVDDILDIEKIEANRVVFKLARTDMRPLVDQVIESNRGFAESYGVHVRLDPASADGEANVDPDRLAQVITNLLSNAIKFSPPDQEVLVAISTEGHVVRISVSDHGPGVPEDFKPRMFEKFAQADATSSRQMGGTGLGLSIAKQIVERLNGKIGFDDAAGGGTIFNVEFPVWGAPAEGEGEANAPPRILHLDDDRDVLAVAAAALRKIAEVVSIETLEAARFVLSSSRIDLAVLDISLGTESGLDLLPYLRDGADKPIPVIIFSAVGADLASNEQVQESLAKSQTSIETLVARVRDRLAQRPVPLSEEAA